MDLSELTKVVFNRVHKLDPGNVGKIMGCIFLREPDEADMMHLAYGSDALLLSRIADARAMLAAISARCSLQEQAAQMHPVHQFCPRPPPAGLRHFAAADHHLALRLQPDDVDTVHGSAAGFFYTGDHHREGMNEGGADGNGAVVPPRAARRTGRRPCHYFIKGMCKNGESCSYAHQQIICQVYDGDDVVVDHAGATPWSLEKLEMEITDLLKSRRGYPVSIASLPTLYGEKYGKGLQADGYLTESQRHGKAGFSLTKLLCRLNKIRVIERPHGQHAVVLAEDAAKYTDCRNGKSNSGGGGGSASSHQIYLTFPAESTFNEEDVTKYFGQYGPVRDVRIPCQDRRMFGFVSFQNPETVSAILMRRNPHYICNSRVLVKPYREKSRSIDRPFAEKISPSACYRSCYGDFEPDNFAGEFENSRLVKRRERMNELERRHFADLCLNSMPPFPFLHCGTHDFDLNTDIREFHSVDPVSIFVDGTNNGTSSNSSNGQETNNYTEEDSNHIELPDSPFTSAAAVGAFTAIS